MTKRRLLYIPILAVFAFCVSALFLHYSNIAKVQARFSRDTKLPFGYSNNRAYTITPEAAEAGIRAGDRIDAFNGNLLENETEFDAEMAKMRTGEPLRLTMSRALPDGGRETYDATILPVPVPRDIHFYAAGAVNFIFAFVLPTFCILLAFWVLFVRPADPLAWILLFVLLGLSSLSFEGYWDQATLLGAFQKIFFGCWAMAMLLFGIYFPERWVLDEKYPWAKWLLIVPLGFQIVLTLIGIFRALHRP